MAGTPDYTGGAWGLHTNPLTNLASAAKSRMCDSPFRVNEALYLSLDFGNGFELPIFSVKNKYYFQK